MNEVKLNELSKNIFKEFAKLEKIAEKQENTLAEIKNLLSNPVSEKVKKIGIHSTKIEIQKALDDFNDLMLAANFSDTIRQRLGYFYFQLLMVGA